MANKTKREDSFFECPACGYIWKDSCDLSFDENERVPCCPDCGELIEDGGNDEDYYEENIETPSLSDLVLRIKGDRSIRQMSKDTNISASYISEMIKGNYKPSIHILNRLTKKSQDISVTINMLIASVTNFNDSKNFESLGSLLSKISPEEIGLAIAKDNLNEWCNDLQSNIINTIQLNILSAVCM